MHAVSLSLSLSLVLRIPRALHIVGDLGTITRASVGHSPLHLSACFLHSINVHAAHADAMAIEGEHGVRTMRIVGGVFTTHITCNCKKRETNGGVGRM